MARIKNYLDSPLIDRVVEEIKRDIEQHDETALCELLIQYLPEEEWTKFNQETKK
jgi:hypothetical protein